MKRTEPIFDFRSKTLRGLDRTNEGSLRIKRARSFSVRMFLGAAFLAMALSGCHAKGVPGSLGSEVAVVVLQPEKVSVTTELPGRTAPFLVAEIRPQVNGLIQKRLFTEGAEIKSGQELYQIDPAPFQAAVDRAQAHLPALKFRANRYKEALADKAVSQQDFDDADAALKQVEAELKTARINLDYTRIVSPISGRIGASTVTEGAIVTAYQPKALATVQQLDPIYVDIPESTTELLRFQRHLKVGRLDYDEANQNKVRLTLADGTPYAEEGVLEFKDVTVDPTTGSVILRAVFPNPEGILLPGMFVRAVITEGVYEQALLVPQQGVARTPKGEPYALIVDGESKVQQRMLTLDRAIKDKWLVLSGLEPGAQVIVEGLQKVKPGIFVKAVPFEGGTGEGSAEKKPVPAA